MTSVEPTFAMIKAMDHGDALASLRDEFLLPEHTIYLNGNSLGALTKKSRERVSDVVDQQWGNKLVSSWNTHHWIDLPITTGEKIAPLLGAAPGQVICCDSVSVNLFKVLTACLALMPERHILLTETGNFPTDLYVAGGLQDLVTTERCKVEAVSSATLLSALKKEVAVLLLTQVNFRSGAKHDIQALTEAAHSHGILVVWDVSHSVGVMPLELDAWGVDFAIGCGYKYLNGGPGAPAFIYANKRHLNKLQQSLQGWMGHRAPFDFSADYHPADGVTRFLTGTPAILSLASLDAAMDVFAETEVAQIHQKSIALSSLFLNLVASTPCLKDFSLESPEQASARGSQLAYSHPQAYAICRALHGRGVIADFRSPDVIRFGFSPMLLRFEDIWNSVVALSEVMEKGLFEEPELHKKLKVT